jgi:NADH-quinone oxidoreductase subunit D
MRESIKIIKQAISLYLNSIIDHETNKENIKLTNVDRNLMKTSMEELIEHFKFYTLGYTVPKDDLYFSIEAPKGEFGIYLVSNGTNVPYRCKLKAPGFLHLQGLNLMCYNSTLADLVTIIGSQDIVFGEIDR